MNFKVPVIILKNLVILPNQEIKLELNNVGSCRAISKANMNHKGEILVVAPTDELEEEPSTTDLPKVGVIAKIKSKMEVDNNIQVKLRGFRRVAVNEYMVEETSNILYSDCCYIDLPLLVEEEENAILKKLVSVLKDYIKSSKCVSNDILGYVEVCKNLNKTTDAIASFLPFNTKKKLEYMQQINPIYRAKSLIKDMLEEIKGIEIEQELDEKLEDSLALEQKEYILKEKLKTIKQELGEESWLEIEANNFKETLKKLKIDKDTKIQIEKEINKYELMNEASPEVSVYHNYLDWVINLPWDKTSKENNNFDDVYKSLNKSHYGLEEIKERISEYVAIKNLNKKIKSPIICLVGPPGVGKTSIAISIASSLNREFYKISVGGLNDSTELIGTRRTYLASGPGSIIRAISKTGVNNPVILIDEVDKMVHDYKGDPAATLLEILDPVQNKYFRDSYIDLPFDLSNVLFILTANSIDNIPSTLLDRLEIINLNSYTMFEKKDIVKDYLLPKILFENMVIDSKIKFTDEIIYFIIKNYTKEAGVRDLERILDTLARKITINNVKMLTTDRITKLLGTPKYGYDHLEENEIGVANILAYTPVGGIVTKCEVVSFKGEGDLTITGSVGDVMKESVSVCLSLLKSKHKYSLNNLDLHFHFLDGSTKKEGPSAGLGIVASLTSLLEKKSINSNIAFTGEVSLNGNILKVGGLKEKLIGAYNMGIKIVYMPKKNLDDLKKVPEIILESLEIRSIDNFNELYTNLFK